MIVITNKGWLGNALFVFANFIACAEENRLSLANPAFDEYAELFQTTGEDFFCRYPARKSFFSGTVATRRLLNKAAYYFTRALIKSRIESRFLKAIALPHGEELRLDSPQFTALVERSQIVFAQGWMFRDRSNFKKHADVIRAYFKPAKRFQENIDKFIGGLRAQYEILIGVHIRHGDFKTFEGGKYYYEVSEYKHIIEQAKELFGDRKVGFLICSNAEHTEDAFSNLNFSYGLNHIVEDMYSFAQCDYLIGPPSTYTMWASFYGQVPLYMIKDKNRAPQLEDFRAI